MIRCFLSIFKNDEYKRTYIETLGAILGTFLAITGVIWTQKLSDKHNKHIQNEKNALIMYYDFKFALDSILEIMTVVYPLIKNNVMPDDSQIIELFRKLKKKRRIYIEPNWRQLVTSLRDELSLDEIREAQSIYNRLSIISMSFNANTSETSRKEDKNCYSLMYNMIDIESVLKEPIQYEFSIKSNITNLHKRIAEIAHVELSEDNSLQK